MNWSVYKHAYLTTPSQQQEPDEPVVAPPLPDPDPDTDGEEDQPMMDLPLEVVQLIDFMKLVLWIRIHKDPKHFAGSRSVT
jgi:hypothetical protein